ncbi:sensory rhodopsin transducer [Peredibacter sp. HCB2-198]|uniref:sensory rhodopsin transducer n=1 Tax=Peredibacter sp. HCB2-198 TaxID=3383025 RepID=UPI0038B6B120
MEIGKNNWAIAEGYIPKESHGKFPELESHETVCMLNAGDSPANVEIMIYFSDREPLGPFHEVVEARRTKHLRFNSLEIPKGKDFASTIKSDVPIVVQHTRLDSRQAENALMTTIAYAQN